MTKDDRSASNASKKLLQDVSQSAFSDVGPTKGYDITKDTNQQRHFSSYLEVAPDSLKILIKRIHKMMYHDFQDYILYYIERPLQNRVRAVSDLENKLLTTMPVRISYPASQWSGMDRFTPA